MRSLKIGALMVGGVLLMVSSCATVPTEPLSSGELRLIKIEVPQKEDLRERLPFVVNIGFEAEGTPEIVTACFFWSGQGPYCSKVTNVTYGPPGTLKVHMHPRNTGPYTLEGYVVYMKNGKTQSTNVVGTHIRVLAQ